MPNATNLQGGIATKLNENIRGYSVGEIQAGGVTTAEIVIKGVGVPVQGLLDVQYIDSTTMDKRPGMQIKYLPYDYDDTGKLVTGGAYLFDTYEDAQEYARWGNEDFVVQDGHKFWEQPMFESHTGQVWKVVGAYNFAETHEHAVARLQQWEYTGKDEDVEDALKKLYPSLKEAAQQQGATSIWVLFSPLSKRVGVELGFGKVSKVVNEDTAKQSLEAAREKESLHGWLAKSGLEVNKVVDKSSLLLTLWLPKSRQAGGTELAIPWYPFVPDITHEHS